MRESALMDFLSEEEAGAGGEWLPTSEKVIGSAQLAEPAVPSAAPGSSGGPSPVPGGEAPSPFLSAPASRFEPPGAGTGLDSNGLRPPGFGPPRRAPADGGPPLLSAEDLEALEDLTYSELVQARGLEPDALERLGRLRLPRPSAAPASTVQPVVRPAGPASTGSPARPAAAPSRPPVGPSLLAPAVLPELADDTEPAAATLPRPVPGTGKGPAPSAPARAGNAPAPGWASYPARTDQDPPVPAPPAETRSFTPAPAAEPPPPDPVVPPTLARFGGAGIAPRREPPGAAPGSSLRATTATATPVVEDLPTWPPPGPPAAAPSPADVDKGLGPVPSRYRPDPSRSARRRRFLAACLVIAVAAVAVWYLAIRPRHHTGSADQGAPPPARVVSAGHPAGLALPLRLAGT